MQGDRRRKWTAAYLWLQAVSVAGWWALLIAVPATRPVFFRSGDPIWPFVVPDLIIYTVFGGLAGLAAARQASYTPSLIAVVGGGATYATLFTIGYAMETGRWVGPLLMLPTVVMLAYLSWKSKP